MGMSQALDHGILNVPLAKRGDIDAQIDAYKREQAAAANVARNAATVQRKSDKATAKVCLALILERPELLATKAETLNVTAKDLREQLRSWSIWEPKKLISLAGKWAPEQTA
jgi:hypothetical protein